MSKLHPASLALLIKHAFETGKKGEVDWVDYQLDGTKTFDRICELIKAVYNQPSEGE